MRVGVIGCGAISSVIVGAAVSEGFANIVALFDRHVDRAERLATRCNAIAAKTFDEFLEVEMDVVVEAASQQAVAMYAERVLEKADLMIMSVGALADGKLLKRIIEAAERNSHKIYLPSGAVAGIDALKAVADLIEEVVLTTRKNPESLKGAPFFESAGIKPEDIKEETLLFEGSAREAVVLFPQNINVAAIVSLAGVGFDRTKVRIIADPGLRTNIHEIRAKGSFGEIVTTTNNVPSPQNPKTSYLAALSAVRTLKNLRQKIVIGT
ncbi:aspartate dehydrogenase [Archaeoglobus veneficus]|uniref:L-aspartate dehydrogenase n=1 Tax=Archaeoglobus veneficus (strain DSM 11195 / SNP6) TaxID=693661 RepID=F2KQ19_ARCVS|nr:aspartate dehydrogenase [Archaeoglobus veneficus]AEA47622.1 L-aspartate dehydrogenase [Archaeoglobus veneficus SNP6]